MFEADVNYLQDKSVLQITLFYFCLSTSDGPRKVLQASPVSSNYSPGLGTLSQNNLLDHFLLWRRIETPTAMTHVFSRAHGLEVLAGAGEICWKTAGKPSPVTRALGADPTHGVRAAQELRSASPGCQSGSGWGSRKVPWLPVMAVALCWSTEARFKKGLSSCLAISAGMEIWAKISERTIHGTSTCLEQAIACHLQGMTKSHCAVFISSRCQQSILVDLE